MSFESELKAHLQSDETIAAIVADKIYPHLLEEGRNPPAITYSVIFGQPENSLDGFRRTTRYEVQIDCWSLTFTVVVRLALAVRDRMSFTEAVGGIACGTITQFPLLDDYEQDTKRHRRSIGVSCWHQE